MHPYHFPPTRFRRNGAFRQWLHLASEVIEIGLALLKGDTAHAARETWDARHSAETLHRILQARGADIDQARHEVLSGNLERGYYELTAESDLTRSREGAKRGKTKWFPPRSSRLRVKQIED